MSLVLAGSTSGSVTLQEPAIAGTTVLTLPAVSGTVLTTSSSGQSIPKAALPTGSVLQVVNATQGTEVSSATGTLITSGLTVSITPLFSTSRILVIANLNGVGHTTNNTSVESYLRRNNVTDLALMSLIASAADGVTNQTVDVGSVSITFLDSPATTSSTSYSVWFKSQQGNATVYVQRYGSRSSITVMEIAT
jgi:hypothetical protein